MNDFLMKMAENSTIAVAGLLCVRWMLSHLRDRDALQHELWTNHMQHEEQALKDLAAAIKHCPHNKGDDDG